MSIPFISGLNFGSFRTNTSAGNIQFLNQGNMGLANVAGFFQTQPQIANAQAFEKSIQLQGLRDQSMFQASLLMGDSSRSLLKKNDDQRRRLIESGAIFA
jgi:hypothetical protein